MKNNAIISEMFEEIKSRLVAIETKLNGQEDRPKVIDEERRLRNNRTAIASVLKQISTYLSTIHLEATGIPEKIQESQQKVLSSLEQVQAIVTKQEKDSTIHHRHVIDLKSSKVVLAFIVLGFVLLGSFVGNVYQYRMNSQMGDNDLMFRYIKVHDGINSKDLSKLEDIFNYHRDKNLIKKIRGEVEEFEMKVRKRAEYIEKKRLNEN
ncbi:hypothetical protein [Sunxiuqinia indica]|uniref:hypothetical protein n=1 Tax=Sunxiuqinia indica TaxID=2692584 RepID=UPI00135B2DB1|nr:hypothetical protein [Sunxiuqinia indica]